MSDITLGFHNKDGDIRLKLYDEFPDWNKDGIAETTQPLVSEANYNDKDIELYPPADIRSADVYINDYRIGNFYKSNDKLRFSSGSGKEDFLPFITYFGYVSVRVELTYEDNSRKTLYTKYVNVVSNMTENTKNAESLLSRLDEYNDTTLGDWVFNQFSAEQKVTKYSYWLGSLRPKSRRYMEAYIDLLKSIMNRYREDFRFFKVNAYHKIEYKKEIISFEKIRRCAQNDFQWLMQNADCFAQVKQNIGIRYQNKNYIPDNILGDRQYKNFDIYENRIVVNFLRTVLKKCDEVTDTLSKQIADKKEIIRKQINPKDTYPFSILTVKEGSLKLWHKQLSDLKRELQLLCGQYEKLLPISQNTILNRIPHTTKVFQEVRYYRDIFDVIRKWFDFGEFSPARLNVMLKIKTMDTLYEYYCLYQILEMLTIKGWQLAQSHFENYDGYGYRENNIDSEICNTYYLQKADKKLTLYYQPKIFGWKTGQNGLQLFRTTKDEKSEKQSYWQPDFVIKYNYDRDEKYAILDAKYSNFGILKERLHDCIEKYINRVSGKSDPYAVKMMVLLQGKVSENDNFVDYHDSKMSELYYTGPVVGIIPLNTKNSFGIMYDKLAKAFDITPVNAPNIGQI